MRSSSAIGIAQIVASGVAFGFLGLFGKTAYSRGVAPGELLGLRFLISALLLGLVLALFARDRIRFSLPLIGRCFLLGIFGYAVFSSSFFTALRGLSASLTVLLLYLYPVFVTMGAWALLGEPIGSRARVALPLAMVGLTGLVWGEWKVSDPASLAFGVGAAIFYSGYILSSRRFLRGADPFGSAFFIQLGAGTVLFLIHFSELSRPWEILSENVWLFFGIAVVSTLIAMSLFLAGLQKIASAQVAVLSMVEPLSGVLIAVLILGEGMSAIQVAGGLVLVFSLLLIATDQPVRRP